MIIISRSIEELKLLLSSKNPRKCAIFVFCFIVFISVSGFGICSYLVHHRGTLFEANDPLGYYIYVRSLVHDHDIDFANELYFFKRPEYPVGAGVGPIDPKTHRFTNQYSIGFPLLVLPQYSIVVWLLDGIYSSRTDLSDFPWFWDQLIFCGSSIVIGVIGMWLSYKFVSIFFPPGITLISLLFFWLASPAIYYFIREPFLSHLASIFGVSLFLYIWATQNLSTIQRSLLMGIVAAIMTMIRQHEVLMVIVPIISWFSISKVLHEKSLLIKSLLFFLIGFFAIFSIQMVVWKVLRGSYFVFSYSSSGQNFSNIFSPRILDVLFSSNHGLLSWHPILLICLLGLAYSSKLSWRLKVAFLLAFVAQLYVIASWSNWWLGHSFGNRAFLGLTPIFVLGLTALLAELNTRKMVLILPFFFVLVVWNGLLMLSYLSERIPYQGEFSWSRYLQELPDLAKRIIEKIQNL